MTGLADAAVRFAPCGRATLDALRETLAEVKAGDPLAPATVAVPGNYAALTARRWLARRGLAAGDGRDGDGGEGPGGLLNVRFIVLARVAELLGAPRLAARGLRPLTEPYRHEAVRAALHAAPGMFAPVQDEAATWRALEATFRDLDGATDAHLEALAGAGQRAADVVAVFREYRRRTARFYGEGDLARAAAEAVAAGDAALDAIGVVVLYLPGRIAAADRVLLDALARAGRLRVVAGLTGEDAADAPVRETWRGGGQSPGQPPDVHPPAAPPHGTRIIAATDPEEEVRAAVREVAARMMAGAPLHRIALLYRHAEPYARIIAEQLDAAELPWNGPGLVRLSQTVAGRTLLGFLDLAAQDFRRDVVAGWLNAGPVLESDGGDPAPSHRWDAIARSARIVRGIDQWWVRLAAYEQQLEREREHREAEGYPTGRVDADLQQSGRLRAFMEELAGRARPPSGGWASLAAWAGDALARYLGGPGRIPQEGEQAAYEQVREALDEPAGLDEVGAPAGLHAFRAALERSLDRPAGRTRRFGEGVFAGRFADAIGGDFDAVYLLGMNEGSVPPAAREDPLLPDAERAAAGGALPVHRAQAADERRVYLSALASAPERVLLYARGELRAQRARLPGRWVVETARALAGAPVFASTIERYAGAPWFPSTPSFEAALLGEGEPASRVEYDLRSLARWRNAHGEVDGHALVRRKRALRDGLEAQRARRGRRLGRWNGLAVPPRGRSPFAGRRPLSPTALQDYAQCPFRFFLGRLLGVEGVEEPEEEDEIAISPLEKGSVVHRVLDRFLRETPSREHPGQPWSEEERRLLRAIGEQECDAAQRAGRSGRALLWEVERARILDDLMRWADEDEALRGALGTVTVETEFRFGMGGAPAVEVDASGGRRALLRGAIDRVDRATDGSVVVIDYKTGRAYSDHRRLDEDPVARGTLLQLPVYAAAARARWPGAPRVAAYYWFITSEAEFARHGYAVEDGEREAFRRALDVVAGGVEAGVFPARPGEPREAGWMHCAHCAFDALCCSDRARAWERVRADGRLAAYLALVEPEEEA